MTKDIFASMDRVNAAIKKAFEVRESLEGTKEKFPTGVTINLRGGEQFVIVDEDVANAALDAIIDYQADYIKELLDKYQEEIGCIIGLINSWQ